MRWMPGVGLGEIDLRVKKITLVSHKNVNLYSISDVYHSLLF